MKKILIMSICFLWILSSCKKVDDLDSPILGLEGDSWEKSPLDVWLYENFTKPYNIMVSYRWDGTEVGINNTLVPTKEDRVKPLMETVRDAWINVYNDEVGSDFIKKLAPRQYMLVGSPQYNSSGTITVGEAESGSKITIFRTNWFDKTDRAIVKRVLKTIHHEFGHILHQNVMYPSEFELITPGLYTSSWNNISGTEANNSGFITPYGMSGPNEDFVELLAVMLTEGHNGYEEILSGFEANGLAIIRQKEDILVTYMKQVWNVDLYSLQNRTEAAIDLIAPAPLPPALHTLVGPGNEFTSMLVNMDELTKASPAFKAAYDLANSAMNGWGSRFIEYTTISFTSPTLLELTVRYRNPSKPESYYTAIYTYDMNMNVAGDVTFSNLVSTNSNGNTAQKYLQPMLDYLTGSTFNLRWFGEGRAPQAPQFGAFYVLNNPDSYLYGELN